MLACKLCRKGAFLTLVIPLFMDMALFRLPARWRGPERIHGFVIPAPRFTRHALRRFLLWILAPFLMLCLAGDLLLYWVFREFLHSCYGLLCFFQ